jgi:hypothetical protein
MLVFSFASQAVDAIGVKVIRVPKGSVTNAVQRYLRNPNVEFADLNYTRSVFLPTTTEGAEPGLGVANNFKPSFWVTDSSELPGNGWGRHQRSGWLEHHTWQQ